MPEGARRLLPLLAAALAVVAVLPAWNGEFVYDDHPYIVDNADLRGGWDRIPRLFRSAFPSHAPERGLYRPLTAMTYRLDRAGGRVDPVRHHATNLILVFALVVAVHALLRRFLPPAPALAGALLFAVHPVHVEAVAWVTGRSEILASLFAVSAVALGVDASRGGGAARALAAGAAVFLGILSKENALVALPLFAFVAWVERSRTSRRAVGATLGALGLAAALALAMRAAALGRFAPAVGESVGAATFGARLPLVVAAAGEHLRLLVWPFPLSVERMPVAPSAWSDPAVLAGLVTLVAWAGLLALVRRSPARLVLAVWPVIALLPVMHLVPIGETVAERFLLLPSVGIAGLAGALLAGEGRARRLRRALLAAVCLVTLAASLRYATRWRFEDELWRHALERTPGSARAWTALGDSYARRDWPDKAEEHFRRALGIDPGLTVARLALAQALDELGDPEGALEESRIAVRHDPDHAVALNNLGARLARSGRLEEAEPLFQRAVERAPGYAPALRNAALAAAQRGDREEAGALWSRALAIDPSLPAPGAVLPRSSPGPGSPP